MPAKIGRYLVIEPHGEGGMGVVFAAYDPQLDRKVAIKLVRPAYTESSGGEDGPMVRHAWLGPDALMGARRIDLGRPLGRVAMWLQCVLEDFGPRKKKELGIAVVAEESPDPIFTGNVMVSDVHVEPA